MKVRKAEAIVPFLNPPHRETQSCQAGAISETPSTWLTLFDPPWRSPETLPHPNYNPTPPAALPYEWLVLAHIVQLSKSSQTSNSWPQGAPGTALLAGSLASGLGFTWESLSPAQVAAISDCFIAYRVALGKTEVEADLSLHHPGNPKAKATHPMDSYRPCQNTTTPPLHSQSFMEGRG